MNNIYYIYFYLRTDGTPYYCGKGCNGRAYSKNHHVNLPKDKSRIIIAEKNLTDIGACALERRYIRWYGRKDLGTGILRNMTDGGEGANNMGPKTRAKISAAHTGKKKGPQSSEQIAKLSAIRKGRKRGPPSPEHRAKLSAAMKGKHKGKKQSPEHIAKRVASLGDKLKGRIPWNKGKKLSSEYRAKMSAAHKGKKQSPEHIAKAVAGREISRKLRLQKIDNTKILPMHSYM